MMNLIAKRLRDERPPTKAASPAPAKAPAGGGFRRLLAEIRDVLNPLQHIPVLSGLYRAISKDALSPTANLLGGLVYGGPLGAALAAVQNVANRIAGKDLIASVWQGVISKSGPTSTPPHTAAVASRPEATPLYKVNVSPAAGQPTEAPANGPVQAPQGLAAAGRAPSTLAGDHGPPVVTTISALALKAPSGGLNKHQQGAIARWHLALVKQEAEMMSLPQRSDRPGVVQSGMDREGS